MPAQAAIELPFADTLASFKAAQTPSLGLFAIAVLVMLSWLAIRTFRPSTQRQPSGILERLPDAIE